MESDWLGTLWQASGALAVLPACHLCSRLNCDHRALKAPTTTLRISLLLFSLDARQRLAEG